MTELTIIKPDDFHNHLRQGELMADLVKETAKSFGRTLVMPNLIPPVVNAEDVQRYLKELQDVGTDLDFIMTFKVMPETTPDQVGECKATGVLAAKLYPQGVSTNSEDGITDIEALFPVFEALQDQNLVLCIHGEVPGVDDMEAEKAFLPTLQKIHSNFPGLRIVLEHTSSKAAVEAVQEMSDKVAATVSVHHLLFTIADVRDDHGINPHHYCRPVCKSESDRKALLDIVFSGHPQFFFGSDSAPHLREDKEVDGEPKRGIYTTPVAMPLLVELFEKQDQLERLEPFTSRFGADFYQLKQNNSSLTLIKESWTVPDEYFGVVPLSAGEQITWKVRT